MKRAGRVRWARAAALVLLSVAAAGFFVGFGAAKCLSPGVYPVYVWTQSVDNSHCWSVIRWPGFRRFSTLRGPPGMIGGDGFNWRYEDVKADPPAWGMVQWRKFASMEPLVIAGEHRAIGFPLVCVSATKTWSTDFDVVLVNGFLVPDSRQPPLLSRSAGELTRTALQVLGCMNWFAFVANAVFFGVVFWCVSFLWCWPRRWRRNGRLRRGECVGCRYPMPEGAACCPECGGRFG